MSLQGHDEWRKEVQQQVKILRRLLKARHAHRTASSTEQFLARLTEEIRRAERYERPCSLLVLSCGQAGAREVLSRVRQELRCTDVVEVIEGRSAGTPPAAPSAGRPPSPEAEDAPPEQVAAILPETNRSGTGVVLQRLQDLLPDLSGDVKVGSSVYPEDGNDPDDLLEAATERAA